MPLVSADNLFITASALEADTRYRAFLSGLRGLTSEILSGLNNGTKSFLGMSRELNDFAENFASQMRDYNDFTLREAAQRALTASERATGVNVDDRGFAASDALVAGFDETLADVVGKQIRRDVTAAETFLRKSLTMGRFFATTEELNLDLAFKHTDRSGRQIDSSQYVLREVNWALRQHYNSILMVAASAAGAETFVVDGGSKAGQVVTLDDYDKISGAVFHHNSKALLQPTNYSVS